MLTSLVSQLSQLLSLPLPETPSATELRRLLPILISKFGAGQPLVLILDALDQMSPIDFGQELDRWIPPNFPAGIKLVLTMLTDRRARVFPVIRKHIYGQPGFERLFVNLGKLSAADASDILQLWLSNDKRSLTPFQTKQVHL